MALTSRRFRDNQQLQNASRNKPPLNTGSTGEGVRLVQQALIELGFPLPISVRKFGSPDGIYGAETKGAVRKFQHGESLGLDGVAGKNTMARLDQLLPDPGDPLPPLTGSPFTHRVRLHFFSIANPIVSEFQALRNAQRVYRQHGIDFSFVSGISLALTPTDTVILNNVDVGSCTINQSTTGEQDLLFGLGRAIGVGPNDISVFYVNRASTTSGQGLAGCAAHGSGPGAVLVAAAGSRWTLGHEVGHVLLGRRFLPTHANSTQNLMFRRTASITGNPPILNASQVTQMKTSRYCIAI